MARTVAKKAPTSRNRDHRQGTGAFWFLLGALVGGFGVGFAWMHDDQEPTPNSKMQTRSPATKPTFDFYQSLPQEEVLVPIEEPTAYSVPLPSVVPPPSAVKPIASPTPSASAKPVTPQPAAAMKPSSNSRDAANYRLQIGSFRSSSDAEQRKAELALLGVRVDIEKAPVDDGHTFRLMTGRLDQSAASALAKKLQSQGVNTLTRRAD